MMTIGDRIRARRQELGLSVEELANRLGKNRATIYRYENGNIKDMPTQVLEPLAAVLETTPAALMGWTDADRFWRFAQDFNARNFPENIHPVTTQTIPVLGEIACGEPKYMEEQYEVYTSARTNIRADFVLIARGDSMINARISDGDLVFIRQQPEVENGEIAAVAIDDEATLKRFYRYGNDLVVLRAENPAYADQEYRGNDLNRIRVLGKAVCFQGNIK